MSACVYVCVCACVFVCLCLCDAPLEGEALHRKTP